MRAFIILLITTWSLSLFAQEQPSEEMGPLEKIDKIYDDFYGIDYRKLEIEDFRAYSNALNELKALKGEIEELISIPSNESQIKFNVYESAFEFTREWNASCSEYTNYLDTLLKATEEDGIRDCYSSDAISCDIEVAGRLKSLKDLGGYSDQCKASFDVVIKQTFK